MKKAAAKHICNTCEHMKREPSLFDEFEVLECSNGLHRTLSIVPVGGGKKVQIQNLSSMVSSEG